MISGQVGDGMKINIAVAAILTGIVTSLTGATAPSARNLEEMLATDKAAWSRISGSICSSCGSEKAAARSVLTNPIAVLAAAPRLPSSAVAYNIPQPKVRTAGFHIRYASFQRRRAQRYVHRMAKERHRYARPELKQGIHVSNLSKISIDRTLSEDLIRPN
jgi:hypothetical protein